MFSVRRCVIYVTYTCVDAARADRASANTGARCRRNARAARPPQAPCLGLKAARRPSPGLWGLGSVAELRSPAGRSRRSVLIERSLSCPRPTSVSLAFRFVAFSNSFAVPDPSRFRVNSRTICFFKRACWNFERSCVGPVRHCERMDVARASTARQ